MFYIVLVMLVAITLRVTPTLSAPILWEFNDLEAREDTKLFTRGNCQGCFSHEPVGDHLSATGDEVDRQRLPNNRPSTDISPADSLRSVHVPGPPNSVSSSRDGNLPSPQHVMTHLSQLNQRVENLRAGTQQQQPQEQEQRRQSVSIPPSSTSSSGSHKQESLDDYFNRLAVESRAKTTGQPTDAWDGTQAAAHLQRVRDSFGKMNPSSAAGK